MQAWLLVLKMLFIQTLLSQAGLLSAGSAPPLFRAVLAPKWLPGAWTSDGMTVQIKSNVIGINRDAGNATRKVSDYVAGAGRINRSATADIEIRRRGNQPVLQAVAWLDKSLLRFWCCCPNYLLPLDIQLENVVVRAIYQVDEFVALGRLSLVDGINQNLRVQEPLRWFFFL